MVIINQVVMSDDLFEEHFLCKLSACRGACCWEGDYGAPLEDAERDILDRIYPTLKPLLSQEGVDAIEEKGTSQYFEEAAVHGTTLQHNEACAYVQWDADGIAHCMIEHAYQHKLTDFQKPISCHLYPVRITALEHEFEALNYERWDICAAACSHGQSERVPLYRFVKNALIRRYGTEFYDQLELVVSKMQLDE